MVGGRHWGPSTPEKEMKTPESPSQASVLLARINARARARKAAKQNDCDVPSDKISSIEFEPGKIDESKLNVAAGIDDFLKQMRNASIVTDVAEGNEKQLKKEKKKKIRDTNIPDIHNVKALSKENDEDNVTTETFDNERLIDCVEKGPMNKKTQNGFANGSEYPSNEVTKNEILAHEDRNIHHKKKKKLNEVNQGHKNSETIDQTVVNENVDKSSKNDNGEKDDSVNLSISDDFEVKISKKKKKMLNSIRSEAQDSTDAEAVTRNVSFSLEIEDNKSNKKRKQKSASTLEEECLILNSNDTGSTEKDDMITKSKKKKKQNRDFKLVINNGDTAEPVISKDDIGNDLPVTDSDITPGKKKKKMKKMDEDGGIPETTNSTGLMSEGDMGNNTADSDIILEKKKKKRKKDDSETIESTNRSSILSEDIADSDITQGKKKNKRKKNEVGAVSETTNSAAGSPESKVNGGILLANKNLQEPKKRKKQKKMEFSSENLSREDLNSDEITIRANTNAKTNKIKKKKKRDARLAKQNSKEEELGDFTLLGEVRSAKMKKLCRTLPHWLAHPTVVKRDLQEAEGSIGLGAIPSLAGWLRTALEKNNITHFFPVQSIVIPELLASASPLALRFRPRDICVSAPTGSGKTLVYVLPILQALKGRTVPRIRALVLLPVQELAVQVHKVFELYSRGSGLKIGLAAGQKAFKNEQIDLVGNDYRGQHCLVDILVATPGRLFDHLNLTPGISLSALRYLVLDEADRMMAAEGGEWVARVEQAVMSQDKSGLNSASHPPHRLLFSATLSHDPELLQSITLHHPRLFTATSSTLHPSKDTMTGQYVRPAELVEEFVVVDEAVKPLVLYHLLFGKANQRGETDVSNKPRQRVLVFTNSLAVTHRLAVLLGFLAPHLQVAEFSSSTKNAGKMMQKRQKIVSKFAAGKINVLVSSDAMARGLDIPNIEYVVSYDVTSANTYVHRIGRTARAGRPGTALSLLTKDSLKDFKRNLRSGGEAAREVTVSMEELEPYEAQYVDALAKMKDKLKEEEQQWRKKIQTVVKGKKSFKKHLT